MISVHLFETRKGWPRHPKWRNARWLVHTLTNGWIWVILNNPNVRRVTISTQWVTPDRHSLLRPAARNIWTWRRTTWPNTIFNCDVFSWPRLPWRQVVLNGTAHLHLSSTYKLGISWSLWMWNILLTSCKLQQKKRQEKENNKLYKFYPIHRSWTKDHNSLPWTHHAYSVRTALCIAYNVTNAMGKNKSNYHW